jgi:hypothetical protein
VPNPAGTTAGRCPGSEGPLNRIFPPDTDARTVDGNRFPAGAASPMIGAGEAGIAAGGAGGASVAASATGPEGGRIWPKEGAATGMGPVGGFFKGTGAAAATPDTGVAKGVPG